MDNLRIKYSKFNKCFFALLLIFLFLISAFNYFVDPFYIYKSELIQGFNLIKPRIKQQERLTKNLEFKLDKNKYDAIFLGSSKVDFSLHPQYYEQITGKKAKNLALVGSSPDEMIEFAKVALKIHPEVNKIFLGLDFFSFDKSYRPEHKFNMKELVTPSEIFTTLLSKDAIYASFATIKANREKYFKVKYDNSGILIRKSDDVQKKFEETIKIFSKNQYISYQYSNEKMQRLADFSEFCEQHKVELILFISPTHVTLLQAIDEAGIINVYKNWKKELTKISPIIDFSFPDNINCEEVDNEMLYYADAAHITKIAGVMVLNKLILKKGGYGKLITQNNIDKYNQNTERKLKEWAENNSVWVEKIRELQE